MPRLKKTDIHIPKAVSQSLIDLGKHLAWARKKRRISIRDMATRMMVSPTTLIKLEKGEAGVSIGALVTVLWVMGLHRRISDLVAPETDSVGLAEESRALPKRVRKKKTTNTMDF